jgi:gluconolactonase
VAGDKIRVLADGLMARRTLIKAVAAVAGAAAVVPTGVFAAPADQGVGNPPGGAGPATPATTTTNPPRDFSPNGAPSTYFSDPDVITIVPAFDDITQGNTTIQRLWHGDVNGKPILWSEGPAWSSAGRYLVWSDIPNNRQLRWLEDDGHVSVFRDPSNNSNGNTFDYQGRQISCEHLTRRVVRYELDGSSTIIADSYQGKHLNSPNDVVPHTDGSLWFTDPPYGAQAYEGAPDAPGGPANAAGKQLARVGQPEPEAGTLKRELPTQCYRWDPSGRLDVVVTEDQIHDPNGILLSPDQKTLYVISTGKGPGDSVGGDGKVYAFDVTADNKTANKRLFTDCMVDGISCGPDGMRCDVNGNVWISSNAGRNLGYSGVTVWDPSGKLLGRVRIPEVVGNIAFGGIKRNRLFMAGSTSLYALYVGTQGAAPG